MAITNPSYPTQPYTGATTTSSISRYGPPLTHNITTTTPQSTYQGSSHRPTLYSQYPVQFIQPYISQRPSQMVAPSTTTELYSQHTIPKQWNTPSFPWVIRRLPRILYFLLFFSCLFLPILYIYYHIFYYYYTYYLLTTPSIIQCDSCHACKRVTVYLAGQKHCLSMAAAIKAMYMCVSDFEWRPMHAYPVCTYVCVCALWHSKLCPHYSHYFAHGR